MASKTVIYGGVAVAGLVAYWLLMRKKPAAGATNTNTNSNAVQGNKTLGPAVATPTNTSNTTPAQGGSQSLQDKAQSAYNTAKSDYDTAKQGYDALNRLGNALGGFGGGGGGDSPAPDDAPAPETSGYFTMLRR